MMSYSKERLMGQATDLTSNKDFQIAILIEDIADAKALSDGLREIGIFAHYYQDLDEMWVALNTYTPDFSIIDVKKMSQGTLLFKHHQKVKDGLLKFAFYYKDSSKILLQSTYGLDHYGYVRAELNLVDQLKSVLRRRNEEINLNKQNLELRQRLNRLRLRGKRLVQLQELSSFEKNQNNMLSDFIRSFGMVENTEDFKRRVVTCFDQWDSVLEFGVFELNETGQKLVSPKFNKAKYKVLPDLWLSKKSEQGINLFAQEMAYDVAYGLMEEGIITLKVQGAHVDPDMLILAQFKQEEIKGFNWEYLEMKLSSEFRRAQLKSNLKPLEESHQADQFELMQSMDDVVYNQATASHRHVLLDFSSLIGFIKQRPTNRFFWKTFARELQSEIGEILTGTYKMTATGPAHFVVSLDKSFIENDYRNLKNYIEEFEYWRYFEDGSLVIRSDIRPSMRLVAPSSINLIRQIESGDEAIEMAPTLSANRPQLEV